MDEKVLDDPISGESITMTEVFQLIDAIPANGGYMGNEDQTTRCLSLHSAYTEWMPTELAIKVARIRRLRKNARKEAALQAAERDARLLAEQRREQD